MEIEYRWSEDKNEQLFRERNLSFGMVLEAINSGELLKDGPHPDSVRYPHQRMLLVMVNGYACAVPYVEDGNVRFLKTIYPTRKINRLHTGG